MALVIFGQLISKVNFVIPDHVQQLVRKPSKDTVSTAAVI
jgi:hypothetical protein